MLCNTQVFLKSEPREMIIFFSIDVDMQGSRWLIMLMKWQKPVRVNVTNCFWKRHNVSLYIHYEKVI